MSDYAQLPDDGSMPWAEYQALLAELDEEFYEELRAL